MTPFNVNAASDALVAQIVATAQMVTAFVVPLPTMNAIAIEHDVARPVRRIRTPPHPQTVASHWFRRGFIRN
jgi:hypothetical protein